MSARERRGAQGPSVPSVLAMPIRPVRAPFSLLSTALRTMRPGPPAGWWSRVLIVQGVVLAVITALVIVGMSSRHHDPGRYFGEYKPGTWMSVSLLLLGGFTAMRRGLDLRGRRERTGWWLLGVMLCFAALDDLLSLHEKLDHVLNHWLGLDPDGWADHFDDIIVVGYALASVVIAAITSGAYLARLPGFLWAWTLGAGAFIGMAACDMLHAGEAVEESFKLFSAGFLWVGAMAAKRDAAHVALAGAPQASI